MGVSRELVVLEDEEVINYYPLVSVSFNNIYHEIKNQFYNIFGHTITPELFGFMIAELNAAGLFSDDVYMHALDYPSLESAAYTCMAEYSFKPNGGEAYESWVELLSLIYKKVNDLVISKFKTCQYAMVEGSTTHAIFLIGDHYE